MSENKVSSLTEEEFNIFFNNLNEKINELKNRNIHRNQNITLLKFDSKMEYYKNKIFNYLNNDNKTYTKFYRKYIRNSSSEEYKIFLTIFSNIIYQILYTINKPIMYVTKGFFNGTLNNKKKNLLSVNNYRTLNNI